jgi:hypothetical protein
LVWFEIPVLSLTFRTTTSMVWLQRHTPLEKVSPFL